MLNYQRVFSFFMVFQDFSMEEWYQWAEFEAQWPRRISRASSQLFRSGLAVPVTRDFPLDHHMIGNHR